MDGFTAGFRNQLHDKQVSNQLPNLLGNLLILNSMQIHRIITQTALLIFLIILEVTGKPLHMAITLKRQTIDMPLLPSQDWHK